MKADKLRIGASYGAAETMAKHDSEEVLNGYLSAMGC